MADIKVDQTKLKFLKQLEKFLKELDPDSDPLNNYAKFEITLIKSPTNKEIYGAFIKVK